MLRSLLPALTLATALCAPVLAHAQTAGLTEGKIRAPHHENRKMAYAIWYPANASAKTRDFGGNAVWQPVQAAMDGAPVAGRYPVVLISHGLGGHYKSLAWLASELAKSGAVVIAVNHPNSTFSDFDMQAGLAHWTRPQDLALALDDALANPQIGPLLDMSRVAAVGFSFGGWTALSMGGVRGNLAGYIAHCAAQNTSHCADIARAGADLAQLDAGQWNGNLADSRIGKVVAIDPGLTFGVTDTGAAALQADTLLIQLGKGADRLVATDISTAGSGFAARASAAKAPTKLLEIAPAYHFSAMPLCTAQGAAILAEEKDDPVCTDPAGADRAAIHAAILAATKAHLGLN